MTAAIGRSDVALVVIGTGWLTAASPDGTRRLDASDDYVRREVAASLAAGVPVVPVLVGGAADAVDVLDAPSVQTEVDGAPTTYGVGQVTVTDQGDDWLIVVEVSAVNDGDGLAIMPYFSWSDFRSVLVDGPSGTDGRTASA